MQCEDAEAWGPFSVSRQVDFTPCFEESVILLLPALFIWLAAPYRIARLVQKQRNRAKAIPYALTTAYMIKMATVFLWMFASFIRMALLHQWQQVQPWLNLTGMLMAFILNHVEYVRNRIASGVLMVYWFVLFFTHAIRLRTLFDTGIPYLGLYCAITLLPLVLLTLECWRPSQYRYIPLAQNQDSDTIRTLINNHNLLDRITFGWVSLVIREDIDVERLSGDTMVQNAAEKPKWLLQANGRSFFWPLLCRYWKPLLKASSSSAAAGLLLFMYPFLALTLIRWIDTNDASPTKTILASISLGLAILVQALLTQRAIFINVTIATCIQSELQRAWDEPYPLVRPMDIRLRDCRRLTDAIVSFSTALRSLLQIPLAVMCLLQYLERWKTLMCASTLAIMTIMTFAVQIAIQASCRTQEKYEQRLMTHMEQMCANQESVPLYGWDSYLREKCASIRRGSPTARIKTALMALQRALSVISLPLALMPVRAAADLPTTLAAVLIASLLRSSLTSVGRAWINILDGMRASGALARDCPPSLTGELVSLVVNPRDEGPLLSYLQQVYPDHACIQSTVGGTSIRDAIVQGRPWDPVRYQKVYKACGLDTTHNAYTTRKLVALARAAYTAAEVYILPRHFLLDLSGPIQQHITQQLLEGMWGDKTRILITALPTTEHVWYWGTVSRASIDIYNDKDVSATQWILLTVCQLGITLTQFSWLLWLLYSKSDYLGYMACAMLVLLSFGQQAMSRSLGDQNRAETYLRSLSRITSMCLSAGWIAIMIPFYVILVLPLGWLFAKIQSRGLATIWRIGSEGTQRIVLASAVQRRCAILNAALASLSLLGASLLAVLHIITATKLDPVLLGCSLLCALYLSNRLCRLDLENWQVLRSKPSVQSKRPDEEQQNSRIHLAPAEKVAVVTQHNVASGMQRRLLTPSHIGVLGQPVSLREWAYIPSPVFGTIRDTLDPLNMSPDADLWDALEQVHLQSRICQTDLGLDTLAHALSEHEQRNLCWARALLCHARVLVIDESNNEVVRDTDNNILHRHFADQVTLIMARQQETVMLAHRVLIVDELGMMAGMYKPQQLMGTKDLDFSFAHLSTTTQISR